MIFFIVFPQLSTASLSEPFTTGPRKARLVSDQLTAPSMSSAIMAANVARMRTPRVLSGHHVPPAIILLLVFIVFFFPLILMNGSRSARALRAALRSALAWVAAACAAASWSSRANSASAACCVALELAHLIVLAPVDLAGLAFQVRVI